jgi:hypothetical protein
VPDDDPDRVARGFLNLVYKDIGARNLPNGQTAPEFVRRSLDRIGLGKELERVTRGGHEYLLLQSSLPGAPPAPKPKGNGRAQNTKAAQAKRLADGAARREAAANRRDEAETRMGRPRKTRSDKGVKRGPRAKKQ